MPFGAFYMAYIKEYRRAAQGLIGSGKRKFIPYLRPFISNHFELKNGVEMTPKCRSFYPPYFLLVSIELNLCLLKPYSREKIRI